MKKCAFIGLIFVWNVALFGQAGLIYKPASSVLGKSVLDPNGDGYVSTTSAGYSSTNDGPSYSEHTWIPLPTMENEPHSDLVTGANGGHTDIVNNGTGQSVYVLVKTIGGIDYLMVRFRIGKASTATKGYSLLIDTDGNFGTVVGNNPGFEKEVVLETGSRVGVYTHSGASTTRNQSYDINEYHHRAVAASSTNGDADYFYDYFVPLSSLNCTTAVRIVGTTITSAQSGISGTVSDFNGIDDKKYGNDRLTLFKAMINSFPTGVTLNDLKTAGFTFPPMKFPAPTVNDGLTTSSTSISGTSTEPNGTVVEVYKNGSTVLGKVTVSSNAYTLSGVSGLSQGDKINARTLFHYRSTNASSTGTTLTVGDSTGLRVGMPLSFVSGTGVFASGTTISSITNGTTATLSVTPTTPLSSATITGSNKTASDTSNTVVVFAAASCYTAPPTNLARGSIGAPVKYLVSGNYANADGSSIPNNTTVSIRLFRQAEGSGQFIELTPHADYPGPRYVQTNGTWSFVTTLSNNQLNDAAIYATATVNGCQSTYSTGLLKTSGGPQLTTAPTILTTTVLESATVSRTISIQNNDPSTAILYLYKSGVLIDSTSSWIASGGTGTITYTGFADGDVLISRARSSSANTYLSNNSNSVIVTKSSVQTTPPIITGTYLNGGTSVSGTCAEIGGTEIKVYKNGAILGTTTLSAFGTWTLTGITLATNDVITAYATAPGKTLSAVSNSVTVQSSAPAAPTITNSYLAGGDTITGTAAASQVVIVYIDGSPVDTVTANGSGNWISIGLKPKKELYKGAVLHATVLTNGIESPISNTKTVGGVDSYSIEIRSAGALLHEPSINLTSGIDFQVEIRALNLPEYTSAASASSSGTTITVASVTGLDTGMVVKVSAGTGSFLPGTKVVSINVGNNTFVVSKTPTTALSSATVTGAKVLSGYTSPVNLSSTKPILLFTGAGQSFVSGHLGFNGLPNNDTATVALGGNGTGIPLRVTNPDDPTAFGETTIALLTPCYWKGRSTGTPLDDKGHNKGDNWVTSISAGSPFGKVPRTGSDVKFANDVVEDMALESSYSWGTLDFNNAGTSNSKHVILGNYDLTLKAVADRDTNIIKTTGTGKLIMQVEKGGTTTFHVGNKRYNPLTITNNGVEADNFKVLVRDEMYANGSSGTLSDLKRVKKTWDISRNYTNSGTGVNLTFTWLSDGSSNGEESQIIAAADMALFHHNGSVWIEEMACGTATVNNGLRTVTATGYIGTFSPFGIGDENQPLPIELLDFSADCQSGYPTFEWTTATETNNSHFNLQQSSNLETWTNVAQITGAGFSSTPKSYTHNYSAFSPSKGLYFRLKQTDFDGKSESFDPIHLGSCLGLIQTDVNVWPNPASDQLEIRGFDPGSMASVVNALGQEVAKLNIASELPTLFKASDLPSGMYAILGQKNGQPMQLKWVRK
jgi:hypothetical protein